MYKLKYLPLVQKDLRDITNYIADVLKAPKAAIDLIDAFDDSISRLKQFPYFYRVYRLKEWTENEYRVLPVNNYMVFYVVKDYDVEIHRIIYAKMNIEKLIK